MSGPLGPYPIPEPTSLTIVLPETPFDTGVPSATGPFPFLAESGGVTWYFDIYITLNKKSGPLEATFSGVGSYPVKLASIMVPAPPSGSNLIQLWPHLPNAGYSKYLLGLSSISETPAVGSVVVNSARLGSSLGYYSLPWAHNVSGGGRAPYSLAPTGGSLALMEDERGGLRGWSVKGR
jgi:hypothetical protein